MRIWGRRDKTDRLQYEFLPAAEEMVESPPSPFGRIVIWLTGLLLAIVLAWSYFGWIDVIATAQGRIIPEGSVKIIQPVSQGTIKSIKITEGQSVKKGQVLIELDPTLATVAVESLEKTLEVAKLERDILREIDASRDPTEIITVSEVSDQMKTDLLRLAQSKLSTVDARRSLLSLSMSSANSQLDSVKGTLRSTEAQLESANARQSEIEDTLRYASETEQDTLRIQLQEAKSRVTALEDSISSQKSQLLQIELSTNEASGNLRDYNAQISSSNLSSVVDLDKKIAELENGLLKAKKDRELQTLVSPVDGTVLAISSKTIGGVVTPAQQLVTIVPKEVELLIEANINTNDIGFIKVGQKVAIKIDTFSFQRYGYLEGVVRNISADVVSDGKGAPVYRAKIDLSSGRTSKNNTVQILPGMTVNNEITTGQRRLIEFFLDPLITHVDESLKMR